jgi:hypothetical protein
MVVSRDWCEISVLECILGGLHVRVDVETEIERASEKLANSKIDALIVDCDLDGSARFLRSIRQEPNTVPLLIIGSAHRKDLKAGNASFVFKKPISVEQAVHKLSAARNLIVNGRLRYHRESLDLPAYVSYGRTKRMGAHLLNVSQGGVAIRTEEAISLPHAVRVGFTLPGSNLTVGAKGEVVWSRQQDAGIRFSRMTARSTRDLRLWLATQYLMK